MSVEDGKPRANGCRVSPTVSVLWKPLARLLAYKDGSELPPTTQLFLDSDAGVALPFVAVQKTRRNRLILWPPTDASTPARLSDGTSFPIDHVTLELKDDISKARTHLTHFGANATREHSDREWALADCEGGSKGWLAIGVPIRILECQLGLVEENVRWPACDRERREREFERYRDQMTLATLKTPPIQGNYLFVVIHLLPDGASISSVTTRNFPLNGLRDSIDEWSPTNSGIPVTKRTINIGGTTLAILTAGPPGRLRECLIGFMGKAS